MTSPARYDWVLWTRSDDPITFTFLDGAERVNLTGDQITFAAEWAGGESSIIVSTGVDDEIVIEDQDDPVTEGMVTLQLNFSQRDSLPLKSKIRYQIERETAGRTGIFLYGEIEAIKWVDHPDS